LRKETLQRVYKPKLLPVNQLKPLAGEESGQWESTGFAPEFRLEEIVSGWVKLSFVASSETEADFTLYVYGKDGFLKEKVDLGSVTNKEQTYSALMLLAPDVSALRLDPGKRPTRFVLKSLKLKKMTEAEILIRTLWNFFSDKQNLSFRVFFRAVFGALSALREGGQEKLRAHALGAR
jgi:hypothetical protein